MAINLPDISSRIRIDTSGLDRAQREAEGFSGRIGSALGAVARVGAVVGAAAGAAGGALFAMGETVDDAFDRIRVGTGATGEALAGLQDDFRAVAADAPSSFDDVSTAVADLNTRLGLTGEPLQQVAGQLLDLSRLTETDVAGNVANVSRLFGDWAVATDDQADALDMLFRAAQATGATVDTLAKQVVQFGGPLRQLGFSLDESLALFGKFEKEGVNIEAVLAGMRQGLARMARAGEQPAEALRRLTREIAAAGDEGRANALAIETFGARAGPDLASAIREGRFALDDLVTSITSGSDTIAQAAADTADFAESWQQVKNQALLAVEPVATRVFGAISDGLAAIVPAVGPAVEGIGRVADRVISVGEDMYAAASGAAGRLVAGFEEGGLATVGTLIADAVGDGLGQAGDLAGRLGGWLTDAIGALDVGRVAGDLSTRFGQLLEQVDWEGLGRTAGDAVVNALGAVGEVAGAVAGKIGEAFAGVDWVGLGVDIGKSAVPLLVGFVGGLLTFDVPGLLKSVFVDHLGTTIGAVIGIMLAPAKIAGPIGRALGKVPLAGRLLEWAFEGIRSFGRQIGRVLADLGGHFVRGFTGALGRASGDVLLRLRLFFIDLADNIPLFLRELGDDLLNGLRTTFEGLGRGLAELGPRQVLAGLRAVRDSVVRFFGDAGGWLLSGGRQLLGGLARGIGERVGAVLQPIQALRGRVTGALADAAGWLLVHGRNIIGGLVSGIRDRLGAVAEVVGGIAGRVAGAAGNMAGALLQAGRDVIGGLIRGIADRAGDVIAAIKRYVTDRLPDFVRRAFRIRSPSGLFARVGQRLMEGLAVGVRGSIRLPEQAVRAAIRRLEGAAQIATPLVAAAAAAPVAAAALTRPAAPAGPQRPPVNITVNNPVRDTAEDSIHRTIRQLRILNML